jgi:hypothetical protein
LKEEKRPKTCISAIFFVSLHLEKAVTASFQAMTKCLEVKSFGDRRKTFARPPQDIAPPAATICHGRGKLVTLPLAPCYIPPESLPGRVFLPPPALMKNKPS